MGPFIGGSSQWGRGDEREPVPLPTSIAFVPAPRATEPAANWADTVPVYEGRPCLSSATLTQGAASIILVLQYYDISSGFRMRDRTKSVACDVLSIL